MDIYFLQTFIGLLAHVSFKSFLPFLVQSVRETFSETIIAPIAHLTAHFAALAVSNPPLSLAVSEWPCKIPKLDPT